LEQTYRFDERKNSNLKDFGKRKEVRTFSGVMNELETLLINPWKRDIWGMYRGLYNGL
jgi:hypothetical protein